MRREGIGLGGQLLAEAPRDRPCTLGAIGDHGVSDVRSRVMHGAEGGTGVASLQHHGIGSLAEPEAAGTAEQRESVHPNQPLHIDPAADADTTPLTSASSLAPFLAEHMACLFYETRNLPAPVYGAGRRSAGCRPYARLVPLLHWLAYATDRMGIDPARPGCPASRPLGRSLDGGE